MKKIDEGVKSWLRVLELTSELLIEMKLDLVRNADSRQYWHLVDEMLEIEIKTKRITIHQATMVGDLLEEVYFEILDK